MYSIHQLAPNVFGGFVDDRGRRIATAEKAIFDTLYLDRARSHRFRDRTEIELPKGFSFEQVRSWTGRIHDERLRNRVAAMVDELQRAPDA